MGAQRVVVRAPGKVNLSLAVGQVDDRGYHALATVFQAVDLYETVTALRAQGLSLGIDSEVPGELPAGPENLALRAAELLRAEHGAHLGAALHIHKQVPIAGGMAGGSADAAATLVALDRLWGLDLGAEELRRLGAQLGADVPFAMFGGTAVGRGNGTELSSVPAPGEWTWLLAVPGGHLSTPEVFRRFDQIAEETGHPPAAEPQVDEQQLTALAAGDAALLAPTLGNDLQKAAFALDARLEPLVAHAQELGALGAIVSGSGPTVAALVEDEAHARHVAAGLLARGQVESALVARGAAPGASVVEQA